MQPRIVGFLDCEHTFLAHTSFLIHQYSQILLWGLVESIHHSLVEVFSLTRVRILHLALLNFKRFTWSHFSSLTSSLEMTYHTAWCHLLLIHNVFCAINDSTGASHDKMSYCDLQSKLIGGRHQRIMPSFNLLVNTIQCRAVSHQDILHSSCPSWPTPGPFPELLSNLGTCTGVWGYSIPGEGVSVCPSWTSWNFHKSNYPTCWEALPFPQLHSNLWLHLKFLRVHSILSSCWLITILDSICLSIDTPVLKHLCWLKFKLLITALLHFIHFCFSFLIHVTTDSCGFIFLYIKRMKFMLNMGEMTSFWRQWIQILYNFDIQVPKLWIKPFMYNTVFELMIKWMVLRNTILIFLRKCDYLSFKN